MIHIRDSMFSGGCIEGPKAWTSKSWTAHGTHTRGLLVCTSGFYCWHNLSTFFLNCTLGLFHCFFFPFLNTLPNTVSMLIYYWLLTDECICIMLTEYVGNMYTWMNSNMNIIWSRFYSQHTLKKNKSTFITMILV